MFLFADFSRRPPGDICGESPKSRSVLELHIHSSIVRNVLNRHSEHLWFEGMMTRGMLALVLVSTSRMPRNRPIVAFLIIRSLIFHWEPDIQSL